MVGENVDIYVKPKVLNQTDKFVMIRPNDNLELCSIP